MNSEITFIEELRKALSAAKDQNDVLSAVASTSARRPGAEVVTLYMKDRPPLSFSQDGSGFAPLQLQIDANEVSISGASVSLPLFVSDVGKTRLDEVVLSHLEELHVKSTCLIPAYSRGALSAVIEFRFTEHYHRWTREESLLLEQVADHCGIHLMRMEGESRFTKAVAQDNEALVDELVSQYQRLARFGNLLIIRTDSNLVVTDVIGDTEELVGLSAEAIVRDRSAWLRFVHSGDLRRLLLKASRNRPSELNEEIRIINQQTGLLHWLMLRAVPHLSPGGQFMGWEGYAVDITDRHNAQEELVAQGKRIEALYAVSRSLQSSAEPALVALKGLNALVNATHSDCGIGYLCEGNGPELELAASVGLSQKCVAELGKKGSITSIVEHALVEKRGILIDDVLNYPGAVSEAAKHEGLRSAVLMPLVFEETVLGVIMLFRRRAARYSSADFDLIAAASSQIALGAREAGLFAAERRQASSLAALYRLSHQLSQQMGLKEVIENALTVIQEELACKRLWLGVINDQGTHIVGQAGVGPGVRQHVIEAQLELRLEHPFLDEALRTKQPVVVDAGEKLTCPDVERFLKQLSPGTMIIVPLVAIGQVVGALVVEPAIASSFFAQRKLPLLNSMAGEIAPVILARRLEARMADAQKMKAASLLASGVAHNFNNLLQAIMGQASLIEMQSGPESKLAGYARMIVDSAAKGAHLVRQLQSVSTEGPFERRPLSLGRIVSDSRDLYQSILGSGTRIDVKIEADCGDVLGDHASLQNVMTNLLMNARDALQSRPDPSVTITVQKLRLHSGEIDPELAPGVYLRLDVEDNGVGMTEESALRCFEPFFTTKNIDARTGLGLSGAGLGLSSAYSIMKKHDGLITVRSQAGTGSTFSLYFPAMTVRRVEATEGEMEPANGEDMETESGSGKGAL